MANIYINTRLGNDTTGTGAIGAPYKTLQATINGSKYAAGDTIFCTNDGTDEVITAPIAPPIATTSGNSTTAVKIIGCKSDWTYDESINSQYVVDANNAVTSCILVSGGNKYNYVLANLTLKRATQYCYTTSGGTANYFVWINCRFTGAGQHGWSSGATLYNIIIKCSFYNNTQRGFNGTANSIVLCCEFYNNGLIGMAPGINLYAIDCLIYGNPQGVLTTSFGEVFYQCTISASTDGINANAAWNLLAYSKLLNNSNASGGGLNLSSATSSMFEYINLYANNVNDRKLTAGSVALDLYNTSVTGGDAGTKNEAANVWDSINTGTLFYTSFKNVGSDTTFYKNTGITGEHAVRQRACGCELKPLTQGRKI